MQHRIPVERLGAHGPRMVAAVEACVHCGFCLSACPTYLVLGEEMDSPRGRIYLMKQVLEGEGTLAGAVGQHVDRCLGCLACVTACPAGVRYGDLLTSFRALPDSQASLSASRRRLRRMLLAVLPYPRRFRWALRLASWMGRLAGHAPWPASLRPLLALVPRQLPRRVSWPPVVPAQGRRRARVALLLGCVQQVLAPQIHAASIEVLTANGVEVVIPPGQVCCGALSLHVGAWDQARRLAVRNLAAFSGDHLDAVVVNAAGCGSALKELPHLLAGRPEEEQARRLATRVRDISQFLASLGLRPPRPLPRPLRVAYHDACHLAHGQGIRQEPRDLLRSIPNVELVELDEPDLCCGSAGIYNLEHPELAAQLQRRKVASIQRSGADLVATGNIGCLVQLQQGLGHPSPIPVVHTVELLAQAYGGCGTQ